MRRSVLALCLAISPGFAAAQVPFNACTDRSGKPVVAVVDNSMGWAGAATSQNGRPVILWNQSANRRASRSSQLFLYLHECAHHVLGHLTREPGPRWEREADCWAIQQMMDAGMLKGRRLAVLQRELSTIRGDQLHLGGEALLESLQQCLLARTDARAWASTLETFIAAAPDSFAALRGPPVEAAEPGLVESVQNLPGTFDCEITETSSVRCLVFAAGKQGRARERYQELLKILHKWLPETWSSTEQSTPSKTVSRQFLAQESTTGTLIALVLTARAQLYLVVRPATTG